MATRDTSGKLHLGMFEQPRLPNTDAQTTTISGRGHYNNLQAFGPDATPNPSATFATAAATPRHLEYAAQAAGAVRPAADPLYPMATRPRHHSKPTR